MLSDAQIEMIELKRMSPTQVIYAKNELLKYQASVKNPMWVGFTKYCIEKQITDIYHLSRAPKMIKDMRDDSIWLKKMK